MVGLVLAFIKPMRVVVLYFFCKECTKEFSKEDNLKVHLRIQTGEKPFPCNLFNKEFTQGGDLKAISLQPV